MRDPLETLTEKIGSPRNYDSPPLHLWHPALSGDIPIRIDKQGAWHHDGSKIARESLVRLFASILRREADGEYYLVTPAEKWRIEVEGHALLINDIDAQEVDGVPILEATLSTGKKIVINEQHSLFIDQSAGGVPALNLAHGLTALCTRSAWYRLAELAVTKGGLAVLTSGDYTFEMPIT